MASDFSGLDELTQLTLLGDVWDRADVGAVVINDARRYLAANPAYYALTGYSREEIADLRAGHNLLVDEMSQADFIDLVTERRSLGQAVIRHKDGTPVSVFYVLIPSQVSELPCYIALLWQQTAEVPTGVMQLGLDGE